MRKLIIVLLALISCMALALGLSACGEKMQERHKHEYIETVTPPTCTAKGFSTYTCECGSKYVTDYVDPLGHDFEGNACKRCDYILHDHIYERTVSEADCTNGGFTQGVCKICGATYKTNFTDPFGHDYENGKCLRCGQLDPDKHYHSYTKNIVGPDCENGGYTEYICECGDSFREEYKNPLGHNRIQGKCTRCGDVLGTEGLEFTPYGSFYSCTGIGTATDTDIIIPV